MLPVWNLPAQFLRIPLSCQTVYICRLVSHLNQRSRLYSVKTLSHRFVLWQWWIRLRLWEEEINCIQGPAVQRYVKPVVQKTCAIRIAVSVSSLSLWLFFFSSINGAAPLESVPSSICGQWRPKSDQGLCCPQTLSLDTIKVQWRAIARMRLCACADWCESVHFAHARRHFSHVSMPINCWKAYY